MTKESALLNASLIHSLMVQFGSLESIHFIVWDCGNSCEVYTHYDPSKIYLPVLEEMVRSHSIEGAMCEDREIKGHDNRIFLITWHWND